MMRDPLSHIVKAGGTIEKTKIDRNFTFDDSSKNAYNMRNDMAVPPDRNRSCGHVPNCPAFAFRWKRRSGGFENSASIQFNRRVRIEDNPRIGNRNWTDKLWMYFEKTAKAVFPAP